MPSVRLDAVAFQWPSAPAPVFSQVDLQLEPGFTAVVGPNGAGKSTLLGLVAGLLRPTGGRVMAEGAHLCAQSVEALEPDVEGFAWDWSAEACRARARLRLDPDDLARWPSLSPGERKRWQIGAALALDPPVLLLDEPTNHLDVEGRELLAQALRGYRGTGLVVSHDRELLRALARRTVVLDQARAAVYDLPAEQALAAHDVALCRDAQAYDQAWDRVRGARQALAQARHAHAGAARATRASHRMKDVHDSDARGIGAQFRAEKAAAKRGRATSVARATLNRAEAAAQTLERPTRVGRAVVAQAAHADRRRVLEWPRGDIAVAGRVLIHDVEFALERGQHVHLWGPNGAGKSTLLAALQSRPHPEGTVWLPQELSLQERQDWLDRLRALPPDERGRVLQIVAALGVAPDQLLHTQHPSPGEARKLALAFGLGTEAPLLVLDEPTNHLDLPAVRRLEEALTAYEGALLLVTHDESLARATCPARWALREGRLVAEHLEDRG